MEVDHIQRRVAGCGTSEAVVVGVGVLEVVLVVQEPYDVRGDGEPLSSD